MQDASHDAAFRKALREQAENARVTGLRSDWESLHQTQLIYGDFLEEIGSPEAAAARANWTVKSVRWRRSSRRVNNPALAWWIVQVPSGSLVDYPTGNRKIGPFRANHTNENPLLWFHPRTLRVYLSKPAEVWTELWFTVTRRPRGKYYKPDTVAHPLGFLSLFTAANVLPLAEPVPVVKKREKVEFPTSGFRVEG